MPERGRPAELQLVIPTNLETATTDKLVDSLRAHLRVGAPHTVARRAPPSDQWPQILQLIGPACLWIPLSVAASAFMAQMGKRAADATIDKIKAVLSRPEVRPLEEVSATLDMALKRSGPRATLVFGLDIPEPHWGTAVLIEAPSKEEIAQQIAHFVETVEALEIRMRAEVEAGRAPLGRAHITFKGDEIIVRWMTQVSHEQREIRLPRRPGIG